MMIQLTSPAFTKARPKALRTAAITKRDTNYPNWHDPKNRFQFVPIREIRVSQILFSKAKSSQIVLHPKSLTSECSSSNPFVGPS
jgi:hypothetical protein